MTRSSRASEGQGAEEREVRLHGCRFATGAATLNFLREGVGVVGTVANQGGCMGLKAFAVPWLPVQAFLQSLLYFLGQGGLGCN